MGQTTADILRDCLFRAGEQNETFTADSQWAARALVYCQRAYEAICLGGREFLPGSKEPWWWLRTTGLLTLAPVETQLVTLTAGSPTITFATPPASRVGWFLNHSAWRDTFRIQAHADLAVTATLDSGWTGQTMQATVTLRKLIYDLAPDLRQLEGPMRSGYGINVNMIDMSVMLSTWPTWVTTPAIYDVPVAFAMVNETTVRFNVAPIGYARVEYDYLCRPPALINSDTQEPAMPAEYRWMIADGGAYFICVDKEDSKADVMGLLLKQGITDMARDARHKRKAASEMYGQLHPRPTAYTDAHMYRLLSLNPLP